VKLLEAGDEPHLFWGGGREEISSDQRSGSGFGSMLRAVEREFDPSRLLRPFGGRWAGMRTGCSPSGV
jgi:hypothetical protein